MKRYQEGSSLVEIIASLSILSLILTIGVQTLYFSNKTISRTSISIHDQIVLDSMVDKMRVSASTSIAVYTPSSCGGNLHGDAQPCNQVRFYGQDSAGKKHFWGWEYNLQSKTIKECIIYSEPDGFCNKYLDKTENIESFTAIPTLASNTEVAKQANIAVKNKEYAVIGDYLDPNQRVIAGNRVVVVSIKNDLSAREIHLLPVGAPFSAIILAGAYSPPQIGVISPINANIIFNNTSASPQNIVVSESNYYQYQKVISQPFNSGYFKNSECLDQKNNTIVSVKNLSAMINGQDSARFLVSPVNPGKCDLTVSTYDQSATYKVTVGENPPTIVPPPSPQPSPGVNNLPFIACIQYSDSTGIFKNGTLSFAHSFASFHYETKYGNTYSGWDGLVTAIFQPQPTDAQVAQFIASGKPLPTLGPNNSFGPTPIQKITYLVKDSDTSPVVGDQCPFVATGNKLAGPWLANGQMTENTGYGFGGYRGGRLVYWTFPV